MQFFIESGTINTLGIANKSEKSRATILKLAARARKHNPYLHYQKAEAPYGEKDSPRASKAIKTTLRLHQKDPNFYQLSSRIKQVPNKHISVIVDLEKAHNFYQTIERQWLYANNVKMVTARVKQVQKKRAKQGTRPNSASRV